MKKLLLNACAIASIAVPGLSLAQAYGDNHDRPAAVRDERHDARQDARQDARKDVRQDVRETVLDREIVEPRVERRWCRGLPIEL